MNYNIFKLNFKKIHGYVRCKVKSTTRRSKREDTGYDRKKGEVRSFTELYGEVRRITHAPDIA